VPKMLTTFAYRIRCRVGTSAKLARLAAGQRHHPASSVGLYFFRSSARSSPGRPSAAHL
jgi:hypothetical protein